MTSNTLKFIDKFREIKNLQIIESQSDIKRLSKDFYNYSPILTKSLGENDSIFYFFSSKQIIKLEMGWFN